ncbi:MAG: response regulator transcription factor [Acidobacteriota bacterium]|nr:response regulator transcription factor [Acidobacteriota bacterium]
MSDILVIDDDPAVYDILRMYLKRSGMRLSWAADGCEGAKQALASAPDLVIVDVMLPDIDGYEVCRRIRAARDVPIMMLTCLDRSADAVVGLEMGADDYVRKPFSPREVEARVKAILRRSADSPSVEEDPCRRMGFSESDGGQVVLGDLRIDCSTRDVTVGGAHMHLTPKEFGILCLMAAHPRVVFTRQEILDQVWGHTHDDIGIHTVDTHVKRLRSKLSDHGCKECTIESVWGMGYRLAVRV